MNKEELIKRMNLAKIKVIELWNSGNRGKGIIGGIVVVLLILISSCVKSCSRSSDLEAVRESLELSRRQQEEVRLQNEKRQAERAAKDKAAREAEEESRRRKDQAEKDACAELKRGDVAAASAAREKLPKLAATIMREKDLPVISICGVALGQPIPESYRDYARGSFLKLKEKFLVFTTMELSMSTLGLGLEAAAYCDRIELEGSHPSWKSFETYRVNREKLANELAKFFPGEMKISKDFPYENGILVEGMPGSVGEVCWTGVPEWRATLRFGGEKVKLEIEGMHYTGFLRKVFEEEISKMEKGLRLDSEKRRQDICRKYGVEIPQLTSTFLWDR